MDFIKRAEQSGHRPEGFLPFLRERIRDGFREYLLAVSRGDGEESFDLFDSFRVLCAVRQGPWGVEAMNALIERLLSDEGLIMPKGRWYPGRPVMITVNNYQQRLFNGDLGIIIDRYVDIMTTTALLPYLAIFLSSFTVALSGAMMPGPLLTTTITESLRRGFITAPLLMAGHGILEMALIYAILRGLSPLLTNQWFFISVSLAGGVILLGMAWSLWRSLPTLKLEEASGETGEGRNLVLKGITVSVSNPYFSIWWATIGLGYIMQSLRFGPAGIASFFAGHILADCLWYGAVALALARGRRFLSPRMYRMLMSAGAALLAFFACYFFYSGVNRLLL